MEIARGSLLLSLALACSAFAAEGCPPEDGIALQVLGSGGPIADDGRASSAYLVWVDGSARVMIDSGGGTFLRFGEAGARFTGLDFVGLSHFHTDHSADFPALLKSGSFAGRERDLTVAGPNAGGPFPGLETWLNSLLNSDDGAYGYLSGYLDGDGRLPRLEVVEVSGDEVVRVFESDESDIRVDAMHVPHGIVPALGFRVHVGEQALVFAGDQNGSHPSFAEFAADADVLVMHLAIPEDAGQVARRLHAPPSVVGEVAAAAEAERVVLSHFMARSLRDLGANVALVKDSYDGEVIVAEDNACITLSIR